MTLKKAGLAKVRLTSLMPKARSELRWLIATRILKISQGTDDRTPK
jgi:hypothetical protein